jgi:AcrR family transcriptional regulator
MDPLVAVLWRTPSGLKRGPRPRFTIDQVVDAAIALADAEGLEAATMQSVADALGATKMALYRYVPGKAELGALMLERAVGVPPPVDASLADWRAQLTAWALALHARLTARPWTLELIIGRRTPGPNELVWFEHGLRALKQTPLDGAERLDVLAVLTNHVRGNVQLAVSVPGPEAMLAANLEPILQTHADQFPETRAAFTSSAISSHQDNALEFGLDRILDGVASLIDSRSQAR